jgi:hypothetical protein
MESPTWRGRICGNTAYMRILKNPAPLARMASTCPWSIS